MRKKKRGLVHSKRGKRKSRRKGRPKRPKGKANGDPLRKNVLALQEGLFCGPGKGGRLANESFLGKKKEQAARPGFLQTLFQEEDSRATGSFLRKQGS